MHSSAAYTRMYPNSLWTDDISKKISYGFLENCQKPSSAHHLSHSKPPDSSPNLRERNRKFGEVICYEDRMHSKQTNILLCTYRSDNMKRDNMTCVIFDNLFRPECYDSSKCLNIVWWLAKHYSGRSLLIWEKQCLTHKISEILIFCLLYRRCWSSVLIKSLN